MSQTERKEIKRVVLNKDNTPMDTKEREDEDEDTLVSLVTQGSSLEKTQNNILMLLHSMNTHLNAILESLIERAQTWTICNQQDYRASFSISRHARGETDAKIP